MSCASVTCGPADRLLTDKATAAIAGICSRQLHKLVASGRFPPPVRLGRSVRWRQSDVDAFIAVGCDMGKWTAAGKGGK